MFFTELCHTGTDQRDYIYFIAKGYYQLGVCLTLLVILMNQRFIYCVLILSIYCCVFQEYNTALKYINRVLQIEPTNQQALALQKEINDQMTKGKSYP